VTTLLVSEVFPPQTGGSGRWFWEIYRRLPREDYLIAAGQHPGQTEFDQTHDLRLVRLPLSLPAWGLRSFRGLFGYGRALRRLRPLLRSEQVVAIHSGRCLPEGLMALALKRWVNVPYACYVHGEDVSTATTSRELSWLVRRVLHGADLLIANSHSTERMLHEEWAMPAERVRVLHPGVDTRRFVPAAPNPTVRARLGWGNRPVVLTVGRLQKRKGHDHLIQALPAIRRVLPDVLYVIVGEGEERPFLEDLVANLELAGHVQFRGEVADEELILCYQQCDLFALPNRLVERDVEGFGMVLLEAQACGKPVVAGASGGTAETLRDPETGRVVDCSDPAPLAACVSELLADRARLRQMGAAGREWVVDHFDWEALSQEAARLFRGRPCDASARREMEAVAP
jgi:phosphatidylinositol alpha-1,6-mannosyltransferase